MTDINDTQQYLEAITLLTYVYKSYVSKIYE